MRDSELVTVVEDFGRDNSPIRLLLCSDVAAEGINLHHLSHRLLHFDIPWSLMTFQQRNGRIDRYGQTVAPQIRYLMTLSENPAVRGDQRVLEVLIDKDEQAGRNIGDPSEFMRGASVEEEEDRVARVIEADRPSDDPDDISAIFAGLFEREATAEDSHGDGGVIAQTVQSAETGLAAFAPVQAATGSADLAGAIGDSPVLFDDALAFAGAALTCIKAQDGEQYALNSIGLKYSIDKARRQLDLTAPVDLRQRLKYLPREARPAAGTGERQAGRLSGPAGGAAWQAYPSIGAGLRRECCPPGAGA